VHFGIDRYVGALVHRLERYFEAQQMVGGPDERALHGPSRGDQALVVGIYGPWGCGKTTWLRRIEGKVRERPLRSVNEEGGPGRITVPVFFNAWQFEREPHLIVPLLKTAEASVRRYLEEHAPKGEERGVWRWARQSMLMLGDAALALASGLRGELSFPGVGAGTTGAKVSMDAGKALETFLARRREREANAKAAPSPLEAYEALYYDLRRYMQALTGRGERPEAWKWIEQAQERLEQQQRARHREGVEEALEKRRRAIEEEFERYREDVEQEMARLGALRLFERRRLGLKLVDAKEQKKRDLETLRPAGSRSASPPRALTDGKMPNVEEGEEATEPSPGHRLDLLFLIDDLDRCLPEKAVEVLESIKLFLEVPGCAFVLGVDDEVIDRGILHRYRDYAFDTGRDDVRGPMEELGRGAPISGAEYLEKIVHLPVRVPPLAETETRSFLQREYPELFRVTVKHEASMQRADLDAKMKGGEQTEAPAWNEELLELFERCVPGVPRKLIRAAELLALLDEVARELVRERCFGSARYEPTLLARLVILQLFAPEVYRLATRPEGRPFLDELKVLQQVGLDPEIERLKDRFRTDRDAKGSALEGDELLTWRKEQLRFRVALRVREVLRQRSRFDARSVVADEDYRWVGRVEAHYRLVEERTKPSASTDVELASHDAGQMVATVDRDRSSVIGAASGTSIASTRLETRRAFRERRASARLSDLQQFLAFALSDDPSDWRRAIAQEGDQLRGRALGEKVFEELLHRVTDDPEKQQRITLAWIRTFEPYLDPDQVVQWCKATDLLGRLLQEKKSSEAIDAIETVCRMANPPARPRRAVVRLRGMIRGGENLDLRRASVWWRYLVGLDGSGADWPESGELWKGADLRGCRLPVTVELSHPPRSLSLDLGRGPVSCVCTLGQDRLVSAGWDGAVRVWSARDGSLLHTLGSHEGQVWGVCALGEDRLASAGEDGAVRVWSARDGSLLQTFQGHEGSVMSVCSLARERLASAGEDGVVRIWSAVDGSLIKTLVGHSGSVGSVCAAGRDRVVSGDSGGALRVWSTTDGSLLHTLKGLNGPVLALCALGEGRVVSADSYGAVQIWSASDASLLHTLTGHEGGVAAVCAVGQDRLASVDSDGAVRVWSATRGTQLSIREGHEGGVMGMCALEEDRLALADSDGAVQVWTIAGESRLHTLEGHTELMMCVCSLRGDRLASSGRYGMVQVWSAKDGTLLSTLEGHAGRVRGVCALGEDRLASGGDDGTVRVWSTTDGVLLHTFEGHGGRKVRGVCALGEDQLASAGDDGTVQVWSATEGSPLCKLEGHKGGVSGVCALGVGRLASVGDDGTVRVWSAKGGNSIYTLAGRRGEGWGVCALGEDRLAFVGDDGTVRVWSVTGGALLETFVGHQGGVRGVCGLGEDRLATAGDDGTVRVWSATDGALLLTLEGHTDGVRGVCAVGKARLASAGEDGTVRIWSATDGAPLLRAQPKPVSIALCLDPLPDTEWPIVLSRSDRAWHHEFHDSIPLPADLELHYLVAFITDNAASPPHPDATLRVPVHAFPDAYGTHWSWNDDFTAIRFKWPTDPAARRALRHYAFGPKYADD